jgi:hypothetical protein
MLHLIVLALTATTLTTPFVSRSALPVPALSELEIEYLLEAPTRRVRIMTPHLAGAVSDGLRRSPTFGAIVRALEDTDVIVQVVWLPHLPRGIDAQLVMMKGGGDFRYLRIHLGFTRRGDDLIALLGHELLHALEIAAAPEVRNEQALAAYYARIGFRLANQHQFDTHEARIIERRIRRELSRAFRAESLADNSFSASR